jgi:hypothetical protein
MTSRPFVRLGIREVEAQRWSSPIPALLPGMKASPMFVAWQHEKPHVITSSSHQRLWADRHASPLGYMASSVPVPLTLSRRQVQRWQQATATAGELFHAETTKTLCPMANCPTVPCQQLSLGPGCARVQPFPISAPDDPIYRTQLYCHGPQW